MAIGTIGAVVYALFRDLFLDPRRRPTLELRFDDTGMDQVILGTAGGFDAASVRLRVTNGKRKDTADDVVVMVTEVRGPGDSGTAVAETKPIGLPLMWSGSNPPLTVAPVHPGSERHIDLLHVDLSDGAPLQLDVSPKPAGGRDVLSAGTYEISVEIRARNADAIGYTIPVSWDGKLTGQAAIWDHLRVQAPEKID